MGFDLTLVLFWHGSIFTRDWARAHFTDAFLIEDRPGKDMTHLRIFIELKVFIEAWEIFFLYS